MDDSFAFLGSQRCETEGMQGRLPIVERSSAAEGDDNILIQNGRIIRHRLDIPRAGEHSPGWRPHKLFPRSRCQRGGKFAARRNTSLGCDQIGEEQSMCLYAFHSPSLVLKLGTAQPKTLGAAAIADGELVGGVGRKQTGDEAQALGEGLRGEKRVLAFTEL